MLDSFQPPPPPLPLRTDEVAYANRRAIKVFMAVVLAHIIVLVIPLLWAMLTEWLKPPPEEVMQIIMDAPTGENSGGANPQGQNEPGQVPPPPESAQPEPTKEQPSPEPPTPTPPTPEPPTPEPPTPTPPTPTPPTPTPPTPTPPTPEPPTPSPEPEPEVKMSEPTPAPVKPKPKPKPTPKPKPKVKKPVAEPVAQPQPEKPVKKYLTADDIKIDKTKKVVKPRTTASTSTATRPQANLKPLDAKELSRLVNDGGVPGGVQGGLKGGVIGGNVHAGPKGDNPGPIGPSLGELRANYASLLKAYLTPRWTPPSVYDLNNQRPEVLIRLEMDNDGRVRLARILQPSGNVPMNNSVQKLLNALRSVPPPPPGLNSIDVIFEPQ